MAQPEYFKDYPPQQKVIFNGLRPGVKYRIRVRAVDGEGNVGSYSNAVDIIAGLGSDSQSSAAVTGLVVTDYPLGVDVTFNDMANAMGCEIYVTRGVVEPPAPDTNDKSHLYYRGDATRVIVKAKDNEIVKVKVVWYDQFGRKSTGIASGQGTALDATGS